MADVIPLPWFRLWTEFATDPEIQSLSFDDQRHYVMVLCLKRMGVLDKTYRNAIIRARVIARSLGLAPREAAEAHHRLSEAGLVGEDWQPRNWDKRQPIGDTTAAERARRYRERHSGVTLPSRDDHRDVTVVESRVQIPDSEEEREGLSLSEFRIPECPKDMDEALEHQACVEYYAGRGTPLTRSRWRSWVLRAVKSGVYAKRGSRPPTEEEIRATRRACIARMQADG